MTPNFDYKTLNVMTPKHAFYGTSTEIINNINISTFNKTKDHIALHLTWEIRERSEQKEWQLPSLLDIIND